MAVHNFQMPNKAIMESESDQEGTFIFKPLEPGYGVTIGNALRRVMLSLIEGYAITQVKFPSVLHEFSAIKGVREDVTDIILNLKRVSLRALQEEPTGSVYIKLSGKEIFTGQDISDATSSFEVLNPELVLCNLDRSVDFEVELVISKGRGYVPAEDRFMDRDEGDYGIIPIDAIFTPVRSVEYHVENTRVEQRTDYEQLRLRVSTNGAIDPRSAVHEASTILIQHFVLFSNRNIEIEQGLEDTTQVVDEEVLRVRKLLKTPLEDLELSVRAYNCLNLAGIKTLMDIVELDIPAMMKFRNFGKKSLTELEQLVAEKGLHFGMDTSSYKTEEAS